MNWRTFGHIVKRYVPFHDKIAKLEEEVEGILSSAQFSIVEDFKPCLILPKSLQDPLRVGQANDAGGKLVKVVEPCEGPEIL